MMALIVTTMLGVPLAALVAGFLALIDASPYALMTFGGRLNAYAGAAAWWLLAFLPTLAYAAYVMPWEGSRA